MKAQMKYIVLMFAIIIHSELCGQNWKETNSPFLSGAVVLDIESSNGELFARLKSGGIIRSIDNGENWVFINNGYPEDKDFQMLTFDKDGNAHAVFDSSIYRYDTDGDQWGKLNYQVKFQLKGLFFASSGNAFIYGEKNLRKSTDMLESDFDVFGVEVSFMKESPGGDLYCASGKALYKSVDDGLSWEIINDNMSGQTDIVNVFFNKVSIIVKTEAGIYLSEDGSDKWKQTSYDQDKFYVILFNGYLYSFTLDGQLFLSVNNGVNWTKVETNLLLAFNDVYHTKFAINGNSLFLGTPGKGIIKSEDNIAEWEYANKGLKQHPARSFALDNYDNLYACLYTEANQGMLFRTNDRGNLWENIKLYYPIVNIKSSKNGVLSAKIGGQLFSSKNHGSSWENKHGPINNFAINNDGFIYICNEENAKFSDNGGLLWHNIYDIPEKRYAKIFAGDYPHIFLAVGNTQSPDEYEYVDLYSSENNGGTWEKVNASLSKFPEDIIKTENGEYFYSTKESGIARSTDYGKNWTEANNGLYNLKVNALLEIYIEKYYADTLLAGTANGLYYSVDMGDSWVIVPELGGIEIYDLAIDDYGYIYAAADRIYRTTYRVGQNATNVEFHKSNGPISVYPNPADDYLEIIINEIVSKQILSIKIINVLGVEFDAEYSRNGNEIRINAGGLPQGMYYFRIITSSCIYQDGFIKE